VPGSSGDKAGRRADSSISGVSGFQGAVTGADWWVARGEPGLSAIKPKARIVAAPAAVSESVLGEAVECAVVTNRAPLLVFLTT
jgi:hypothetical protein